MAGNRHVVKVDPALPVGEVPSGNAFASEILSPVLSRDLIALAFVEAPQDGEGSGDFGEADLLLDRAKVEQVDVATPLGPAAFTAQRVSL